MTLLAAADAPPPPRKNVLGGPLAPCCARLRAGYLRDGTCRQAPGDAGQHLVCAEVTEAFLDFTRTRGNDLSTARPESDFPGLAPGDRWCLCAGRWREAEVAGRRAGRPLAPPVVLAATDEAALALVPKELLLEHAVDPPARH